MSFHNTKKINSAKKQHKCLICKGKILIGDTYFVNVGKNDYGFYDYKVCDRCEALLNSHIGSCLWDDDNCVGEYSLVENLIMAGHIVCPECNSQDVYNYIYTDDKRTEINVVCEQCENNYKQSLLVKDLVKRESELE